MRYNKLIISSFAMLLLCVTLASGQTFSETQISDSSVSPTIQVQTYPNPVSDFLMVEIVDGNLNDAEFEIHSIIGNQMKINPEYMGFGKYKISVKDFAPGYYFLVVKDEKARFKFAKKLLKANK